MTLIPDKTTRLRLLLAIYTRELKTAFFLALSDQPSLQVVAAGTNTAELLTFGRTFQPDAIALEWELPGGPVAGFLPTLTQACSSAEILIISRPSSRQQIRDVAPYANVFDEPEELINTLEALKLRQIDESGQSQTKEDPINHDYDK
jgi:DNA-binding NarL/FixJ family response regulator